MGIYIINGYATMRPIEGVEMRKIEITVTDQEV